jgi:hypothetical protein
MTDKSDDFVYMENCNYNVTWQSPAHVGQQFCVATHVTRNIANTRI